jgi:hypothetical protein
MCLALGCLASTSWIAGGQEAAKKNWGVPTIVVDATVKSDFGEIGKKVREMDDGVKCNDGMKYEEKPRVVGESVGKVGSTEAKAYAMSRRRHSEDMSQSGSARLRVDDWVHRYTAGMV